MPERDMNVQAAYQNGKPSICFVAPNNYAILSGRTDLRHIGGAEIQQPMIARELLRRGYPVSFITADHGQPDGIEHDGIRVYKMCAAGDGVPVFRFVHPRWTSLWSAMSRAHGDVYYQMTAGAETGQVALWCALHKRPFFFATASDSDCDHRLPRLSRRRERALYRYGLRRATRVIVQTATQRRMLRRHFGIDAALIRACSADPTTDIGARYLMRPEAPPIVLWVGRFSKVKRLDRYFDVAQALPEYQFHVVGSGSPCTDYSRALETRAASIPNVVLNGHAPHAEVALFYRRAHVLCCTSDCEGYPNTFMEAWSRGLPVVSTVDPDGVIAEYGLGVATSDMSMFIDSVRRLVEVPGDWASSSARARSFWDDRHRVETTAQAYEGLLSDLALCTYAEASHNAPVATVARRATCGPDHRDPLPNGGHVRGAILGGLRKCGLFKASQWLRRNHVTILTIHGVMDVPAGSSWRPMRERLSPCELASYLQVLARSGYKFVTLSEAVEMINGSSPIHPNAVAITFDDGYRNNATRALTVLERYGAPATFFVNPGVIERGDGFWWDRADWALQYLELDELVVRIGDDRVTIKTTTPFVLRSSFARFREVCKRHHPEEVGRAVRYIESCAVVQLSDVINEDEWAAVLSWDELRGLAARGVTIGSHTYDHMVLDQMSEADVIEQCCKAKSMIEREIGASCDQFCYPSGQYVTQTIELVKEAGYTSAVTTINGVNGLGADVFALRRINVPNGCTDTEFLARACGISDDMSRLKQLARGSSFR